MIRLADEVPNLKKRGQYHIGPCPFCGGEDRFTIKTWPDGHESWLCRYCAPGKYKSVTEFLVRRDNVPYRTAKEMLGNAEPTIPQAGKTVKPRKHAWWKDWNNASSLLGQYTYDHDRVVTTWQAHKPVKEKTILRAKLGVGVLPSSHCTHERLIVPIFGDDGHIVCFRGRQLSCNCADRRGRLLKWLAPAGWQIDELPLYNLREAAPGGILWVVENMVDALLVGDYTDMTGVATLSTSYWLPAWTMAMAEYRPSLVVVAYDNDLVGNGGAQIRSELLKQWRENLPPGSTAEPPEPAGVRVVNALLENGMNGVLYDWSNRPARADIGMLFQEMANG